VIETPAYRLELEGNGAFARVTSPDGAEEWLRISLGATFDGVGARDETLALDEPEIDGRAITVVRRSTRWHRAQTRIECHDDAVEVRASVAGEGELGEVHPVACRRLGTASGLFPTGVNAVELFTPNPGDPRRTTLHAGESAVIGVSGDGLPGRGHWFFTPAPLALALRVPRGDWLGVSLLAPVDALRFVQAELRGADRALDLVFDYEGRTSVSGAFDAPVVRFAPAARDGYAAIADYRAALDRAGAVPPRAEPAAAWWHEPIFCGWGAQCALSRRLRQPASTLATQANYDRFLEILAAHGIPARTIVIDDKWQSTYGRNEVDDAKWADLPGWIARRHEADQHVLLWWKAWDPEGVDPALCIRSPDGVSVALDPTNERTRELIEERMHALISSSGLGADGLKVDFTARTPSGSTPTLAGDGWGVALLHELLAVVYAAVKHAKPEALVITHTPHPSFVDVSDMIRLNDMLRLDDPDPLVPVVPQMRHRAAVVRAACPELLIDTDDWAVPNKEEWRAYLEVKGALGVPSLYYTDELDVSGERLDDDDYDALRRVWEAAR